MESYDLFMLVVLAGAMAFGAWKGLAWQIASFGAILLSTFMAANFSAPLADRIAAEEPWNGYAAMALVYVGTTLAVWMGFQWISGGIHRLKLRACDRQLGALLGLTKGTAVCLLITLFGVTIVDNDKRQAILRSRSGQYVGQLVQQADERLPEGMLQMLGPHLAGISRYFDPRAKVERISAQSAMKLANMSMEAFGGEPDEKGSNSALPISPSQLKSLLRAATEASQRQTPPLGSPAAPETVSNSLSGLAGRTDASAAAGSGVSGAKSAAASGPPKSFPGGDKLPAGAVVNPHFNAGAAGAPAPVSAAGADDGASDSGIVLNPYR